MSRMSRPRSVYVAASSAEIPRAKRMMHLLRKAGFIVTSTWCEEIEAVGQANPVEASEDDRARWSDKDLQEAYEADVLLHLFPVASSGRGSFVEMGFTLGCMKCGMEKWFLSVGEPIKRKETIFTAKATAQVDTEEEALAQMCAWATAGY